MNQPGDYMPIFNTKIVMRSIDVGGDDTGEVTAIFFSVGTVHGINETFGVCVSFVGGVGWSIVEHGFVNGVGGFVGEDTG